MCINLGETMEDSRTHVLKTRPPYFHMVKTGEKPFEIRLNDRCYQKGDRLRLKEWIPPTAGDSIDGRPSGYTGEELTVVVTCVTDFEQKPGYVVLGIKPDVF